MRTHCHLPPLRVRGPRAVIHLVQKMISNPPQGIYKPLWYPHPSAVHPILQGQKLRLTKVKGYTLAHNYAPVEQREQLCPSPQR